MEYDLSLGDFNDAIRLDPTEGTYFLNRGVVWSTKKDLDRALRDYDEAIRLGADDDVSLALRHNNRGNAWKAKGDFDKAMADYSEAIRLDPQHANSYWGRGNVWVERKEYDIAIRDFDEALRIDRNKAEMLVDRARAWRMKGDYDKALADYEAAMALDPKLDWLWSARAWLRATCPDVRFRDGEAAVAEATKACELSEWKKADRIGTLSAAHAEAGDFAKAVEFCRKAIELDAADDDETRKEMLALFEKGEPYRLKAGE